MQRCQVAPSLLGRQVTNELRAGVKDEQRCENVTTNSLWSPNVTSSLPSSPLPSTGSAPVHPLSILHLFATFLCTSFHLPTSLLPLSTLLSLNRTFSFIFLTDHSHHPCFTPHDLWPLLQSTHCLSVWI